MKTIFVTCFHPFIFRNILGTEAFARISSLPETRIVVVVQGRKKDYFQSILGSENVIVEGFSNPSDQSPMSRTFRWISRNAHHTDTVRFLHKRKLFREGKFFQYFFFLLPTRLIGHSRVLVSLVRFLDRMLVPAGSAGELFLKYNPDVVFSTDVYSDNDVIFLQEARRRGVASAGMVRSWDKLTWFLLRAVPDRLIVWSDLRKQEAAQFNYVPEERVVVTGVPHYAKYLRENRPERGTFLSSLGLDPADKVIFFVLTGDHWVPNNTGNRYVLEILSNLKENVIVRFPVVDKVSFVDDFSPRARMVLNKPGVTVENAKRADTEISEEDDEFLSNAIFHSDVVVCGPSTVAIDAALFHKPVILTNLYPEPRDQWHDNALYHSMHYKYILASGGARMATSKEELTELLHEYLENPDRGAEGRAKMLSEQCGPQDGKAEERLAKAVLGML